MAEPTIPTPRDAKPAPPKVVVPKSRDDIPDDSHCPECGIELTEDVDRVKHAVMHYGDAPLRDIPQTLVARQRRAFLMDEDIPRR